MPSSPGGADGGAVAGGVIAALVVIVAVLALAAILCFLYIRSELSGNWSVILDAINFINFINFINYICLLIYFVASLCTLVLTSSSTCLLTHGVHLLGACLLLHMSNTLGALPDLCGVFAVYNSICYSCLTGTKGILNFKGKRYTVHINATFYLLHTTNFFQLHKGCDGHSMPLLSIGQQKKVVAAPAWSFDARMISLFHLMHYTQR